MSASRSWDVQPKKRVPQAAAPVSRNAVRPRAAPMPPKAGASRERLRVRRKRERKVWRIVVLILFLTLVAGALYILRLPQVRIQDVSASGPGAEHAREITQQSLSGAYGYIIPRNSIFLFPKERIRQSILVQHPEVAAVSIKPDSFSSITILTTPRAAAFVWCGVSSELPADSCYEADAEGLVFKPLAASTATTTGTTTQPLPQTSELLVYAPLTVELSEGQSAVGTFVQRASFMPDALRFVRAIRELGVPVEALTLREDEADLWVNEATRITYVLGREQEAAELAASVIPTLDLGNGSIMYLDLRFSGRAYVKRYGEELPGEGE